MVTLDALTSPNVITPREMELLPKRTVGAKKVELPVEPPVCRTPITRQNSIGVPVTLTSVNLIKVDFQRGRKLFYASVWILEVQVVEWLKTDTHASTPQTQP